MFNPATDFVATTPEKHPDVSHFETIVRFRRVGTTAPEQ
jgi:hypothetical protein